MSISDVKVVSDGIMVTFDDLSVSYFPAEALYRYRAALGSQSFLNYDPSLTDPECDVAADPEEMASLDEDEVLTGKGAQQGFAVASRYTLLR